MYEYVLGRITIKIKKMSIKMPCHQQQKKNNDTCAIRVDLHQHVFKYDKYFGYVIALKAIQEELLIAFGLDVFEVCGEAFDIVVQALPVFLELKVVSGRWRRLAARFLGPFLQQFIRLDQLAELARLAALNYSGRIGELFSGGRHRCRR